MPFSPEFNRLEQKSNLEEAHKKALSLNERYEIKPESFTDLYGEQVVNNDLVELKRLEGVFKSQETPESREMKMWAEVMEAIILEQGEQGEWFGDKASTIKTSRYDDIKNGVDAIVEFEEGINRASHAGLAIDATYSDEVGKKVKSIKNKIDSGKLGVVKYFESEQMPLRGELSEIPITIVTANAKTVRELAELWANNDKKSLANHWVQFQILEELIEECKIFSTYANKVGQLLVAQRYDHIKEIAEQILIDKQDKVKDTGQRDNNFRQTLSDIEWMLK